MLIRLQMSPVVVRVATITPAVTVGVVVAVIVAVIVAVVINVECDRSLNIMPHRMTLHFHQQA
jgi:phage shock protein PspC (stress-responsive transcriptional regulator)